jgi:hypothetical protein
VGKRPEASRISPWAVLLLMMAIPKPASAYVDPGSGAMLWQMAAAGIIGSLFYVRRIAIWLRRRLKSRSAQAMGYLFAGCFAMAASPLVIGLFHSQPVPRFDDVFLVGIALTSYLFTWKPAVLLLAISILESAWILSPGGTLASYQARDWYQLCSFAAASIFLMCLVTRLKSRSAPATLDDREIHSTAPSVVGAD